QQREHEQSQRYHNERRWIRGPDAEQLRLKKASGRYRSECAERQSREDDEGSLPEKQSDDWRVPAPIAMRTAISCSRCRTAYAITAA
ncbi:MAG: hypothetical protein ACR2HZ_05475, partial [Gemmatimonadaceae bacterium]